MRKSTNALMAMGLFLGASGASMYGAPRMPGAKGRKRVVPSKLRNYKITTPMSELPIRTCIETHKIDFEKSKHILTIEIDVASPSPKARCKQLKKAVNEISEYIHYLTIEEIIERNEFMVTPKQTEVINQNK